MPKNLLSHGIIFYEMNRNLTALFITIISLFASCREDDVRPEQEKCKNIIKNISTYKQKVIDFSGRTQNNSSIAGYFDGNDLKMATVASYSLTGRRQENYFFHNNHLIAVKQEDYAYNMPQYITEEIAKTTGDTAWYDDTKTIMRVSWYYFYNGKMVKWVTDKNTLVPDNDRHFDQKDDELQHNAGRLKEMLLH